MKCRGQPRPKQGSASLQGQLATKQSSSAAHNALILKEPGAARVSKDRSSRLWPSFEMPRKSAAPQGGDQYVRRSTVLAPPLKQRGWKIRRIAWHLHQRG